MKKVLFFTFILALVNNALCDSIFKSDYSDFTMDKLLPLGDKEYVYEMDKMCQSKYKFSEKEEIKKYLGISSKTIMERLEELQEFRDNDKYRLYQAEQTLTEIKEIAEEKSNVND